MMNFIVIGLIVFMTLFDLFVSILNDKQKDKPLPESVKDVYDEAKYTKWLRYALANQKLGIISSLTSAFLMVLLLVLGVFSWFESLSKEIFSQTLLQYLMFLLFFLITNILTSLPFKIYRIFKIEQSFGFNKMTKKLFMKDQIKSFLLTATLGGATFVFVYYGFTAWTTGPIQFVLLIWLFLSLIILIVFYLNTKVFVKLFNKLTPLEDGELKDLISALAEKSQFKIDQCYIMDASKRSTKLNAFFSGFGKTRSVVLFDTLVDKMTHDEILAVLAHELGHAKYKDTVTLLIQQIISIGLYAGVFGFIMSYDPFFTSFQISTSHLGFGLVLWFILLSPLATLISIFTNKVSRTFEYRADHYAATMTKPKDMKDALIRLYQENLSNLNPHPLYVVLHYNHPTLAQRLESIEKGATHAI